MRADLTAPGIPEAGAAVDSALAPGSPALDTAAVEAELLRLFDGYEEALRRNDLEAMAGYFWESARVRRFGLADEQRGATELRRWRAVSGGVPVGRYLEATDVLVLNDATAVVTTRFGYGSMPATGRQTQVWARLDGAGWRIVSAHVSDPG